MLGGLQPPNNLLKFVDFVSEKGSNSQGRRNENANSYIFEEATRIYQNCNIFLCHRSLTFQNFHGKTPISHDSLLSSMAHFPKNGAFSNDLKGVVIEHFPGGKPPDPHFCSLRSHLVSAPPI